MDQVVFAMKKKCPVVVCGRLGSGKTTFFYRLVQHLKDSSLYVIDPELSIGFPSMKGFPDLTAHEMLHDEVAGRKRWILYHNLRSRQDFLRLLGCAEEDFGILIGMHGSSVTEMFDIFCEDDAVRERWSFLDPFGVDVWRDSMSNSFHWKFRPSFLAKSNDLGREF